MAKHVWSVLCRKATIDKDTNVVSLFEVMEALQIAGLDIGEKPGVVPITMELVTFWARSDVRRTERVTARYRLRFPDGSEATGGQIEVNLTEQPRLRTFIKMQGFPVKGSGNYEFLVDLRTGDPGDWVIVAQLPIEVTLTNEAAAAPAAAAGTTVQ